MKNKNKVKKLWSYFKIQDEDIVVVKSYNDRKQSDEYFVATKKGDDISVEVYDKLPEQIYLSTFVIVSAIGNNGKHIVPSASKIIRDREKDY